MGKRVIVIEDDENIANLVGMHLEDLGFQIEYATEGNQGLSSALENDYDLVLLDVMLPGLDGLEICKKLRDVKPRIPIVMLTAKGDELDRILGLELGADDYITKPFSIRELIARVKAVMRRADGAGVSAPVEGEPTVLDFGSLVIDLEKRRVRRGEEEVELTSTEFDLLAFLAKRPGKPYSREELLSYVWDYEFSGYERTVTSHVNRLRAKIEPDPTNPTYVLTARGVGYRFTDTEGSAE